MFYMPYPREGVDWVVIAGREYRNMSVADDHCGECDQDPCICLVVPSSEEPISLKRSHASLGQRRFVDDEALIADPEEEIIESDGEDEELLKHNKKYQARFKEALHCDERYSPEPDLDAYFDDYHLSAHQRIAMCRTYANYLTQKLRASGKMAAARVHKKK